MTGPGMHTPSTKHLERLIREACETLPGPDNRRMLRICDDMAWRHPVRAHRPRKRRDLPWWVVGLLLAGAATAGWWAGSTLQEEAKPEPPVAGDEEKSPQEDAQAPLPEKDQGKATQGTPEPAAPLEEQRSPVIYQREAP